MDCCCFSHAIIQTDGTLCCMKTAPKSVSGQNLAPRARLSRVDNRKTCLKDISEVHVGRRARVKEGPFLSAPIIGSSRSVRAKDRRGSVWSSDAPAVQAEIIGAESVTMNPIFAANLVAEEVHDSSYVTEKTLVSYDLNFADTLHSISALYAEVGEDSRQAAEYLQDVEKEEKELRAVSDYNRRAYLYGRVAEIVQARQKKGERVCEDLEQLQEVVMEEDWGRSPADYKRRAEIFSKSAEVFCVDKK